MLSSNRAKFSSIVAFVLGVTLMSGSPASAAGTVVTSLPTVLVGLDYSASIYDAGTSGDTISNATLLTTGPDVYGDALPSGLTLAANGVISGNTTDGLWNQNATFNQICINFDVTDGTTFEVHNAAGCFALSVQYPLSSIVLPNDLTVDNSGQELGVIETNTGVDSNASSTFEFTLTLYVTTGTLTLPTQCDCTLLNKTQHDVPTNLIQIRATTVELTDVLRRIIWTADPDLVSTTRSPAGTLYGAVTHDLQDLGGVFDPVSRTYYFKGHPELLIDHQGATDLIDSSFGPAFQLATPSSKSQSDVVRSLLVDDTWINGQYNPDTDWWSWVYPNGSTTQIAHGDGSSSFYTDWHSGQPNNFASDWCMAYTHISNETIFGWDDTDCSGNLPSFIVEHQSWDGQANIPGAEVFPASVTQATIHGQEPPAGPWAIREGGDSFLRGHYVEVGVANNGHFGSSGSAPAGFHPSDPGSEGPPGSGPAANGRLGFVSDRQKNGWGTGYDDGDFFVPGDPFEGWGLEVSGETYWNTNGYTDVTAASQDVAIESDKVTDTWISNTSDTEKPARNGLEVKQVTTVKYSGQSLDVTVTLKNVQQDPISGIYYSRQVDPDNGVVPECGANDNSFATHNVIASQAENSGVSLVYATTPDVADWCTPTTLSTALGNQGGTYLGIFSTDVRSKVGIQDSGFDITAPSGWVNQITPESFTGCQNMGGPEPAPGMIPLTNQVGTQSDCDAGIGIGFDIGTLNPGQSTTLTYSYILSADQAQATIIDNTNGISAPVITGNQTRINGSIDSAIATSSPIANVVSGPIDYYSVSPALPAGLSLDPSTGMVSGTPTTAVTHNPYTLTAHNLVGTSSVEFSLLILGPPLEWTDSEIAPIRSDVPYLDSVTAFSGDVVTYSVKPGTHLPPGLSLDSATGEISGTATLTGLYDFTIYASTSVGQIAARFRGSVVTGEITKPRLVSTAYYNTCVINSDRSLSCLGGDPNNTFMQGNSNAWFDSDRMLSAATQVPGVAGLKDVSAEVNFACGRDDRDLALCWGGVSAEPGSIGMGSDTAGMGTFSTVNVFDTDSNGDAITGVTSIDTTPKFSCALVSATDHVSTNQVDCWGINSFVSTTPTPLELGGTRLVDISSFKLLGLGNDSNLGGAICYVTLAGDATCKTLNGDFKAGWSTGAGVKEFAATEYSACALLLDGGAQCWNPSGGIVDITSSWDFTNVNGLSGATSLAVTDTAGYNTYCAVIGDATANQLGQSNSTGTVSCWGWSLTGAEQILTTPRKMSGWHDVIQLSSGSQQICAMTVAYDISCIGANFTGTTPTNMWIWNDGPIRVGDASNGTFTTVPGLVQNLSVVEADGKANVSWDAPLSDGNSPIVTYMVYFLDKSGYAGFMHNSCVVTTSMGDPKNCSFELPAAGENYQVLVYAINSQGTNAPTTSDVFTVPGGGGGGGGGGVTQPSQTPVFRYTKVAPAPGDTNGSIMLSVNGANVQGATGVVAEIGCECMLNGAAYWHHGDVSHDFQLEFGPLPFNQGLVIHLAYTIDGTTLQNANFSDYSSDFTLTPYQLPEVSHVVVTGIPGTPTDTVGMANVNFDKPTLPNGTQYDTFTVQARPRSGGHPTVTVVSATNPVVVSGLAIGVTYDYSVKATSYSAGSSAWTSSIAATLSATPKYTPVLPVIGAKLKPQKTMKIAAVTSQQLPVVVATATKSICTVTAIKVKKKLTGYLVKANKLPKGKKSAVCSVLVSVTGNDTYNSITKQPVAILIK